MKELCGLADVSKIEDDHVLKQSALSDRLGMSKLVKVLYTKRGYSVAAAILAKDEMPATEVVEIPIILRVVDGELDPFKATGAYDGP